MAGHDPEGPPAEEVIDLQRAFARIPKADRWLLWHAYVDCEKSKEIAAGLGVAPDAARRRVSRAAQRLREALGPGYGKDSR